MDFGSSHVYAGDQSDVYYSSVPKEIFNEKKEDSYAAEEDPVYESIDDVMKNKPRQRLPDLPPAAELPAEDNTYDAVADENYREPETAWDAIPKEKPSVPAKPKMYQPQSSYTKTSSLAEKLRKALQDREKELAKKSSQVNSVSQHEDKMPVAPPRKSKLKAAASVPPPIPSRDIIDNDTVFKSLSWNKKKPTLTSDSLINFDKPPAAIPCLKPPPIVSKQVNVLPNAPFDPFSIHEDECSFPLQNALQPTLLEATPVFKAPKVVKELPVASAVSPERLSRTHSDSTNPFTDIPKLKQNPSFDSTSTKPPLLPKPSNIYTSYRKNKSLRTETTTTVDPATPAAVKESIDSSSIKTLYPTLPNNEASADKPVQSTQAIVEPSAPALSPPLVREDIEFFESQLPCFSLVTQSTPQSHDDNLLPSVDNLYVTQLSKPSAPQIPQYMMKYDEEKSASVVSRSTSFDSVYASADTNIVCVKLGILAEATSSWQCQDNPSHCETCGGIAVNATPSFPDWKCNFCESTNKSTLTTVPSNAVRDVTYVLNPPSFPAFANESLVVFCVDTSGSMCVTSRVDSSSGSLFVSRLKSLEEAIASQLSIIENTKPSTRVALVTFNSAATLKATAEQSVFGYVIQDLRHPRTPPFGGLRMMQPFALYKSIKTAMVQVFGDGSPEQNMVLSEYQLFDFDYLSHVGYMAPLPGLIVNTRAQLTKTVFGLQEGGGTALGPALVVSTAMASKLPGSQVIVCTDGRANVGVGSLETEDDYSMCHHFYNETTALASSRGVVVSILSISGTDCRLVQLGKISDKTAGKVSVVEACKLSQELGNVMSDNVLATNVSINLITQKQLFFNSSKEGTVGSSIGEFIGNVTNESEVTFRYGIRREGEFAAVPPPSDAHFQLKIMYRSLDGTLYLRVLTEKRAVTESREVAESALNPAVIGTYVSHFAAKLALQGDLDNAKQVTEAHKKLLDRGINLKPPAGNAQAQPESDVIYECVMKRMTDIGKELSQADAVSTCSSDQSQDATYREPDLIQEEVYDDDEVCNMQNPPVLPPRAYLDRAASKSTPKLSSSSSFETMLSKLPSIPKGSLMRKRKSKRHKEKTAMQYKDQTAQKMFNMSKTTTFSFSMA